MIRGRGIALLTDPVESISLRQQTDLSGLADPVPVQHTFLFPLDL